MDAKAIFEKYKQIIIDATHPDIIVEHVGGSIIKWAIEGKGDVDMQIRVVPEKFESTTAALKEVFAIKRPELRNDNLTVFKAIEWETPIDIVITKIWGDYDYFHLIRDAIENDPELLAEYNAIKVKHQPWDLVYLSEPYMAYSKDKHLLYKKIFKEKFDKIFS